MDDTANHYYVIFGAAVKPDGQPSGTLLRRVQGAWQLGKETGSACFIVTGGVGEYGAAEGLVMQQLLLEMGVPGNMVIVEDQAANTMQSIVYCKDILDQRCAQPVAVTVCSSPYHNYRCQLLFRMLGVRCQRGTMPSDRTALGMRKWLYYYFREAVAIPWSALRLGYWLLRHTRRSKKPG